MTYRRLLLLLPLCCLAGSSSWSSAEDAGKVDPRYPFRTDFANANLPWYQPKAGEFPPHHSDRRIGGELVSVDFVRRRGEFRSTKTGELVEFTMPPYGTVNYLNTDADLRDVPLGTFFLFFLNQDLDGHFTKLATMQDQFTMDAGHGFSYRLDEAKLAESKLLTTKHKPSAHQDDLGKKELLVKPETHVWKGDKAIQLSDLAAGDELLYNITGRTADSPGWCTDIWVGAATHQAATENLRKKYAEFTKKRGLPGWVDKTEGNTVTVTLFSGDAKQFQSTYMGDFAVGKDLSCCVANDEQRTWNPPVDKEKASLLEIHKLPVNAYGTSGVQVVFKVTYMLEGFRRHHVVRLFGSGWPIKDTPYGESLMGYGYSRLQTTELMEPVAAEYPEQYPFRTDVGNHDLPWYQVKGDDLPPPMAEHVITGALVKADPAARTGQFRTDTTGEVVDFTLLPKGSVKYINGEASLGDIPLGTRCRFSLFQDDKGAFTRASLVSDEYSYRAANVTTFRIESLDLKNNKVQVAYMIPKVKNYNGDMVQPEDFGRAILLLAPDTRFWKEDKQVAATDLAVGDQLLFNLSGEAPGAPSHCTEVWIGTATHELIAAQQSKKLAAAKATKPKKK